MTARRAALAALRRTRVCAILDDGLDDAAGLVRAARALRRCGLRVFQLRGKRTPDGRLLALAGRIRAAVEPGGWLLVNDRCDLALAAGAAGVHLGADDLPLPAARGLLGAGRIVGASAGTPAEMARALAGRPDYVSVGPLFGTRTKADAGRALGEAGARALLRRAGRGPMALAIGGITPDNVGSAIRAGATAVAVASWWWSAGGPERAARSMRAALARI